MASKFSLALIGWLLCSPALASDPALCTVIKVTDGDSLSCRLDPPLWGPYAKTDVRIAGIDTPESQRRFAKCVKELRLGLIAKAEMKRRVPVGSTVTLDWTGEREKYGRVLANVTLNDGKDWASEMIRLGMARPYTKANLKKSDWCK